MPGAHATSAHGWCLWSVPCAWAGTPGSAWHRPDAGGCPTPALLRGLGPPAEHLEDQLLWTWGLQLRLCPVQPPLSGHMRGGGQAAVGKGRGSASGAEVGGIAGHEAPLLPGLPLPQTGHRALGASSAEDGGAQGPA